MQPLNIVSAFLVSTEESRPLPSLVDERLPLLQLVNPQYGVQRIQKASAFVVFWVCNGSSLPLLQY